MPQRAAPDQRIPFTCTLDCGGRCELVAHVREGEVVRVDTPPDRSDTVQRPRLIPCARGRARRRLRHAPERVLEPLQRTGPRGEASFRPIAWDDALDEIAGRMEDVRRRHGTEALLHATGAGSVSGRGFSGASASGRFFSYWGPVTETVGNMSNHCAVVAAQWMLGGRQPGSDRATLRDARLILLWGMNPAETRLGPNTAHFIAQARDLGARVVLIDPRYTDSGILADQWIPIRPGTDAALAAAMAYVMETEALVDLAFIASHTTGYAPYRSYVLGEADGTPKTPAWAEARTGVPADTIRQLARDYGSIKPAALLPGWAPQRTLYGEQSARALITLACMSGSVGIRGGGLASVGTQLNAIPLRRLPHGPHRSGRRISGVTWAQEVLQDRLHPSVAMTYIVASNLINRSPDTRANAQALAQMGTIVVNEPFLTPTARYADIVLPICTDLERPDLVTAFAHDGHLFYSRQAVAPAGVSRTDYWVFSQLAERLGFGYDYTRGKSEDEWTAELAAAPHLDVAALARDGVMRTDGEPRVALSDFRADPMAHPLLTPSGRIEIACSQAAEHGLPEIPSYVEQAAGQAAYPLQLITPHSKLRSNSCLHANPWLQRVDPHAVWISARDAAARGIADGEQVEVFSERGVIRIPAKVTERIMPGVVCVYQGTWYRPAPDSVDEGGCANVLTSHRTSPTGGCATHSEWVEMRSVQA